MTGRFLLRSGIVVPAGGLGGMADLAGTSGLSSTKNVLEEVVELRMVTLVVGWTGEWGGELWRATEPKIG